MAPRRATNLTHESDVVSSSDATHVDGLVAGTINYCVPELVSNHSHSFNEIGTWKVGHCTSVNE